jgi:hypothetical protein
MSTDFRALCAELVDIVTAHCNPDDSAVGYCAAVLTRARVALGQPEPEGPPMPVPGDAEGLAEVFWGRYDQPEPVDLFARIDTLLDGIDRDECHPDGGWWQTSDGSRLGRIKLRELKELIASSLSLYCPTTTQAMSADYRSFALAAAAEGDWDAAIDNARSTLPAQPVPVVNQEVTQLCCTLRDRYLDLLIDQRNRAADLLERLAKPEPVADGEVGA